MGNCCCHDDDPVLAACGISIEKQLTQVEGRVLEPPKVSIDVQYCVHRGESG